MAIRRIPPGGPIPDGEPRRYPFQGYVVLRWKVGPQEYVEILEHRWVMGNPDADVHHRNGVKDDNRPENLLIVTPAEHGREHRSINPDEVRRLYESGMTQPQIAEHLGINSGTVSRLLRRAGGSARPIDYARMGRKGNAVRWSTMLDPPTRVG